MNGLCQQCQVYYPMPEDFARGVPYACPQCQAILVPYEAVAAAPAPAPAPEEGPGDGAGAGEAATESVPPADARLSGGTVAPGGFRIPAPNDPDAPADITLISTVPEALRENPAAPAPEPPGAPEGSGPRIPVLWFHPHASPEVAAAREAMGLSEPKTPAGAVASLPPGGGAGHLADPWLAPGGTPSGARNGAAAPGAEGEGPATTFVLRGAGEGVSREELPVEVAKRAPVPAPAAAEPPPRRTQEPVPRFRQMTTAAPVRHRGRGAAIWAVIGLLLVGGGAATWYLTRPGAGNATDPTAAVPVKAPGAGEAAPAAPSAAEVGTGAAPAAGAKAPEAPATPTPRADHAPVKAHRAAPKTRAPAARAHASGRATTHAARAHAPVATPPARTTPTGTASPAPSAKPAATATPPAKPAAPSPPAAALDSVRQGNLLFGQGKIDEAITAYQAALKLDARSGLAHRGLGVAYAKLGRAAAAAQEYQRYLDLDPNAPDAAEVRRIVQAYYAQQKAGQ